MMAYLGWRGAAGPCSHSGAQTDKVSAIFHVWFPRFPWVLASNCKMWQEREGHTWEVFIGWNWRKHAWLLLSFHCQKWNHMVMLNCKGHWEMQASCIAALFIGTALFLFTLSPATPQRGLTFPPLLESQFSAAESPSAPTWRTRIESWHATFWQLPTINPNSISCISQGCCEN